MAEIKFEKDYASGTELAIPIGRLLLGGHSLRLYFTPAGSIIGVIPKKALTDGSLVSVEEGFIGEFTIV